jgi:glycolate oxidase subunit GlcD
MLDELREIVGEENFFNAEEDLTAYSRDFSFFKIRPLCIVRSTKTEEVVRIVKFAYDNSLALIPRGAGTNTCGEAIGEGIIVDMSMMNKIIEVNERDFYCTVQPGVILEDLNRELRERGLFFPPDPASSKACTIGGMVANNSSGLRAVKYGTTRDYVMGLQVVLPVGKVIETGTLAPKSSSGYNLTGLFVGSEGTLGIFTKVYLRILPRPEYSQSLVIELNRPEEVGPAVKQILTESNPSALEFIDDICLASLRERYSLRIDGNVALLVEFDGDRKSVAEEINRIKSMEYRSRIQNNIWEYRKNLVPALVNYKKDVSPYAVSEDIGVPISKVTDTILKVKEIYANKGFEVAIYGHCGDGNLHMRVFADEGSLERAIRASDEVYKYVLKVGGTVTAEHGVGLLRRRYLPREHGNALHIMRKLKKAIDPKGIMNPGKIFEEV